SEEITSKISETGLLGKMQLFLGGLSNIVVEPLFEPRGLDINPKVKFLENGQEISIDKKGLGTKRRITMALLEFKKDQAQSHDKNTIYLLDEPDTHLHVRAQLELLKILEGFSEQNHQVICATHSPFIINAVKPSQIRLLNNDQNQSTIKNLGHKKDRSNEILRFLGIENTYLFFARHIIVVEGETEENFISAYYERTKGKSLEALLMKVINVEGIENIVGFARAMAELQDKENVYLLLDNDASDNLRRLIRRVNLQTDQQYFVGTKEFEDAFSDETLYSCWCQYLQSVNKQPPSRWSVQEICGLRQACIDEDKKFSSELRSLNSGGKKMTKPLFGKALGNYIDDASIPQQLSLLFQSIGV
ncbi:MAG: AAA family ATPase, partial [Deinococcota bacterium]